MDEIDAQIRALMDEISRCNSLSLAASNLSSALGRIGDKFNSCAASLASGGFTINDLGADAYSGFSYKDYVTNNIDPIIRSLDSICSIISTALSGYNKELINLKNRREELLRQAEKDAKNNSKTDGSNKSPYNYDDLFTKEGKRKPQKERKPMPRFLAE